MVSRRRGITLVTSLLFLSLLMVMGLAFLSKRVGQYRGALAIRSAAQARAIAMAGLEDARVKLDKDFAFPPQGSTEQLSFNYSEPMRDIAGTEVGSYTVTVDRSLSKWPYAVVRLTSIGTLGPVDDPLARRRLYAEVDISPTRRGTTDPNENLHRFINFQDGGTY